MSDLEVIVEPGRQDIVVRRGFDAPREVVFRAMTEPDLVARWWGLKDSETRVDRSDIRPGGTWRVVERMPNGEEHAFRGVVHDVTAPGYFVRTFEYEGMPGHVMLETHRLESDGDRTLYTAQSVFQSVEDRDGMVASGMESGMAESMGALDEVIASLV
ncbi:SRPBCC family protein [Nocardiopsis sp. FIRDI 009]|uniref:SRPBCC family protein n=1 Tax=Nocardiopsis sp. FIRDI 009 TaxID=714197 RepID=UPI000E261595|nr:SRPBCC family protein [Nocardiopsis sp. FIRDI 009]